MHQTTKDFDDFQDHSSVKKLTRLLLVLILGLTLTGSKCTTSSGTEGPQITIQNARAIRDEVTDLPVITVDYTVKYPSDLYPQTLNGVPRLNCAMKQKYLTQDRVFNSDPLNITGTSARPQNGQITISVPDGGRYIKGSFDVTCTLASDKPLGTSNTISVDVPATTAQAGGNGDGNGNGNGGEGGKPCPSPLPKVTKKCPWTPEGFSVGECTEGFCWDGGPQGSLACKQEQSVPNSGRTDLSDLRCSDGYQAERDPCTGVILRCVAR